jgi:G3E family GTPase
MKKNRCNIKLIELIAHARRRTFTFGEESGKSLSEISRLDTMVTVVDSKAFLADYTSRDDLQERKLALSEEDDRSISNLLNDQIEFANVLLINKADAVSEEEMGGFMRKLNPDAKVIECVNGNIDASLILNTGKFDIVAAQNNPGWLKEMRGEHTGNGRVRYLLLRLSRPPPLPSHALCRHG